MSWICRRCETENPDALEICEVCEAKAPKVIRFEYDKILSDQPVKVRWEVEDCESVSLAYKGETIDVTAKSSYALPNSEETAISLVLNNEVAERTFNYIMEFLKKPAITFKADKQKFKKGKENATLLQWKVTDAKTVHLLIDGKCRKKRKSGKLDVHFSDTTLCKLEVLALDGKTIFSEELLLEVFDECAIEFKSDKNYTYPSVPVTLSWNVTNAKRVTLDSKLVKHSGTLVVEPNKDTTYILKAKDEFGTKENKIEIKMLPIPQIKSLLVPTPNIVSNMALTIKKPELNVEVKVPEIEIGWAKTEIPFVPSLTDLKINAEVLPIFQESIFVDTKRNSNKHK